MEENRASDDLANGVDSRFKNALLLSKTVEERRKQQIERYNAAIEAQLEQDRQREILLMKRREEQKMLHRQTIRYKMQEKLLREREGRAYIDRYALERIKRYQELYILRFYRKSQLDEAMLQEELEIKKKLHEERSTKPWLAKSGDPSRLADQEPEKPPFLRYGSKQGRKLVYGLPSFENKALPKKAAHLEIQHQQYALESNSGYNTDVKNLKHGNPNGGEKYSENREHAARQELPADVRATQLVIRPYKTKPARPIAQQKALPIKYTTAAAKKSISKLSAVGYPPTVSCGSTEQPFKTIREHYCANTTVAPSLKARDSGEHYLRYKYHKQASGAAPLLQTYNSQHNDAYMPKFSFVHALSEEEQQLNAKNKFKNKSKSNERLKGNSSGSFSVGIRANAKAELGSKRDCAVPDLVFYGDKCTRYAAAERYQELSATHVEYMAQRINNNLPIHAPVAQPPLRTSLSIAYSPAESGAILQTLRRKRAVSARVPKGKRTLRGSFVHAAKQRRVVTHAVFKKYDPTASQLHDERFAHARYVTQILSLKRNEDLSRRMKDEAKALAEEEQRRVAELKRFDEQKMQRRVQEQQRLHQRQAERREMEALIKAAQTPAVVKEALREWKHRQAENVRKSATELERYEEAVRNSRTAM